MAVVGSAYKIGNGAPLGSFPNQNEVFGPCAAAAVYRRTMLEELGGFDEDFFLIYEDADLSMRARLRGHRCLYVPEALVYHRVNQSIGTFSHNYVFYGHRNSECLFWKNMPTALLIRYFPERCLFNLLAFLYFAYHGRAGSFLAGKVAFFKHLPSLLQKRKEVQAARVLSNREIRQFLDRNWLRYRRKPLVKV
jgi:GT2 family glycosyltransferase